MAQPATAPLHLPDLLPPCDEVARALGAETEMEPDERIERMTDLSNTPTQIFMPPNWVPLMGRSWLSKMAEPDDVEYVRKDIADAWRLAAYGRGVVDAVAAIARADGREVALAKRALEGIEKVAPPGDFESAQDGLRAIISEWEDQ